MRHSDNAIDSDAVELNRTGLENPLPWHCSALFHWWSIGQKIEETISGDI
jgi:hypothetical protein